MNEHHYFLKGPQALPIHSPVKSGFEDEDEYGTLLE
jgi:hypothetical protein